VNVNLFNRSFPERNKRSSHSNNRNMSWALKESSTGWYSVFVSFFSYINLIYLNYHILIFKVPNVENRDEVLKIIQTYISPVVFYPYNVCYFYAICIFIE